jgi:N6-L-threonylcarbamoyladenine synthase
LHGIYEHEPPMVTLGIETSCDETSVALFSNGSILANEVFTQLVHTAYGGVVPELASRAHISKVDVLAEAVFKKINVAPSSLGCIAVTDSPGLAGALLVGISFALGLHCQHKIPITGVNHLEGHIHSLFLTHPSLTYPFIALIVSGGHTAIYRVDNFAQYTCLGQTVDDAAGEAFDKIGKLLGFPYPAGRAIEEAAASAQPDEKISFPIARFSGPTLDFSFSGLKTAVKNFCAEKGNGWVAQNRAQICSSFQKSIIDALARNLMIAAEQTGIRTIGVAGGVACNGELRRVLGIRFGENVLFPAREFCTDNAAMIARVGHERYHRNMLRFPRMDPSKGL